MSFALFSSVGLNAAVDKFRTTGPLRWMDIDGRHLYTFKNRRNLFSEALH